MDAKIKKPFYKRWWFITIMFFLLIGLITPNETSENPEPETINVVETTEVIVDVPQLINSSPEAAETLLGPGDRQYFESLGDISWTTDEYYIEAHYENDISNYVFFSYDKNGASREEVFAVSNISFDSPTYSVKAQEWLDQAKAESINSVEIAGIHVEAK